MIEENILIQSKIHLIPNITIQKKIYIIKKQSHIGKDIIEDLMNNKKNIIMKNLLIQNIIIQIK